jgi:hypothetical protein
MLRRITRRHLLGFKLVVVVPDSDGSGNRLVSSQANALARRLRLYGANAIVASPPAQCGAVCTHLDRFSGYLTNRTTLEREVNRLPNADHKQGIDDFLGPRSIKQIGEHHLVEGGGTLSQLIATLKHPAQRHITEDELVQRSIADGHYDPTRRARSDWYVLQAILDLADPDTGIAVFGQELLARQIDWPGGVEHTRRVVQQSLDSLEQRCIIDRLHATWPDRADSRRQPPTTVRVLDRTLIPQADTQPLAEYAAKLDIKMPR